MDQRVTEGAESTDSLQQQEQIESAPLLTTEETGVAGVDTKGQQSEGEGEAAGLDTNLDMEVDQALTSMEGLARALCMDVDSVFEFTEKLEEMLRPSTARTDRTEEEDDDDHAAALFEITRKMTGDAGLPAYEISNHARPGHECRHNLIYWQSGNWLGIGPGAHSRFTRQDSIRIGISTRRSPAGWLDAINQQGHATDTLVTDGKNDWAAEMLMMGLRLTSGLSLARIFAACGAYHNWLDPKGLHRCLDAGWLVATPENTKSADNDIAHLHIRTSETGAIRLNHILAELIL